MPTLRTSAAAACAGVVALLTFVPAASAVDEVNTKKFRDQVTVSGILQHARTLQAIANQNGGTRASGTPGYDASIAYAKRRLEAAGYQVTTQDFTFPFTSVNSKSVSQVAPTPTEYETDTYEFSGSGDVTGRVVPVNDNVIPASPEPSSTAGCEASDFTPASATEPEIALIQRGTCTFRQKADNAVAAGYDAVLIFNEGNPGRTELFVGTLDPPPASVPVLGLSYEDGRAIVEQAQAGDVTLRVAADITYDPNRRTTNLLADTKGGDPDKVLVVGAHPDSVIDGPGINDNGSGSATILEIAEELAEAKVKPRQKVRFALWGAEESGLLGSEHYVESLGEDGVQSIFANLNFDMLGSPNYVRFVYDGDGSDTVDPATGEPAFGPPGSAQIEDVFNRYFASQGLATEPTAFDGRSDYGPFIAVGIPAGGLFSGAEGIKTPEQAAVYGGTAGEPFDPCYHSPCDTMANLSTAALYELGDGAAHATLTLARTKSGFYEDGSRASRRGVERGKGRWKGSQALR
jgi:Zn-dependent M28 family amino/carboxypeptidase